MVKRGKRGVPVSSISRSTALSCLRQLSRSGNLTPFCDVEGPGKNDGLPLDQFIALARPQFRLRPAVLDWHDLSKTAKLQRIFLILQNGNLIHIIGAGRAGREELVVSDPLYQDGKYFFLPRNELDHVWRGNALLVSSQLANWSRAFHWFILIISIAGTAAGTYIILGGLYTFIAKGLGDTSQARQQPETVEPRPNLGGDYDDTALQPIPSAAEEREANRFTPLAIHETEAATVEEVLAVPEVLSEVSRPNLPSTLPLGSLSWAPFAFDLEQPAGTSPREEKSEVALPSEAAPANLTSSQSDGQRQNFPLRVLGETELKTVIARGDLMISKGDIHSGRLVYEYAADAGSGPAALRLGETFDPAFLRLVGMSAVKGDPLKAAQWYERASQLGVTEADILLRALVGISR